MNYLHKLFSSDDSSADTVALAAGISILGLIALAFYEAVQGHYPGIAETGTGLAAVIGPAGAVRAARPWFSKQP